MNLQRLREAEGMFLERYPDGFESEELKPVLKRHNVGRLTELAVEVLAPERFRHRAQVLDDIVRIVSRSSMVSMFEKPKFRDYVNGLSRDDRALLADGFEQLLHADQALGFEQVVDVLKEGGLAKWSLVTVCPFYLRPRQDVFVKPTTTKNVIRRFELDLVYRPQPTWEFYAAYRAVIEEMKAHVSARLAPNNAAFTGFLMMTTGVQG